MNNHVDTDNRDASDMHAWHEAQIEALKQRTKEQEERIAAMARRIVELMAENQMLSEALTQARWSIQEAARIIQ